MQESADVACRQLGYEAGIFHNLLLIPPAAPVSPPWLTALRCDGSEAAVLDCERPPFADTVECGLPQQLFCTSPGTRTFPPPFPPPRAAMACLRELASTASLSSFCSAQRLP